METMRDAVLVINSGSSSIKFALYYLSGNGAPSCLLTGKIDDIGRNSLFHVTLLTVDHTKTIGPNSVHAPDHANALSYIFDWLSVNMSDVNLVAAGHRVVHGGTEYTDAVQIDDAALERLHDLIPLAPLHQPHALHAIKVLLEQHPDIKQVACFDTAFHSSMPWYEQQFALPQSLQQQGVRRYGFHGLSYEYIASVLPDHLGEFADGKIVVAHLGHGVSMCALKNRQSMATSMSFTPLDGLPMGRRSGAVDPAVVLYLLKTGLSVDEVSRILHYQSGLLGLSGVSDDMQTLLRSSEHSAQQAVDYFCYRISRELASLAAVLHGIDALVFTGGIGEHAAQVRTRVCNASAWLGITVDESANAENAHNISAQDSRVAVLVIPTNEEYMIAKHTFARIDMT